MSNCMDGILNFSRCSKPDLDYSVSNTIHRHIRMKGKWKKTQELEVKPQSGLSFREAPSHASSCYTN